MDDWSAPADAGTMMGTGAGNTRAAFPAGPEAPPAPESMPFSFSGSGGEYFRIWIVNLLLTVATLGIYSAWAKTRRLQYFYRNTRLDGAGFDFHGNPFAILRGRIVGLVLLAAWHYGFGFSLHAGLVTIGLLAIALPFMIRSALRFRLANTTYRGLPFGFDGGIGKAYAVYLLPMTVLLLPGALAALLPGNPLVGLVFLLYFAWPWMDGAMRRYQQRHLMYGDQRAAFPLSVSAVAKPYLWAALGMVGWAVAMIVVGGVIVYVARSSKLAGVWSAISIGGAVFLFYLGMLLLGLMVVVRIGNLVWSATMFPGVGFACTMKVRGYGRLQVVNVILTVITLGLFRPFAAVRTWRYRVAHLRVDAPGGFGHAVLGTGARRPGAAGDGVADFLDIDLSW